MKSNKKQYRSADVRSLFGKFSHAWGNTKDKYGLVGTSYCSLILVTLVIVTSGFLFGCGGGGSQAAPPPAAVPPTLPAASTLPSSCTAAATVGAFNCQITVSSGKAPFTWTANKLPLGLRLTVSADTTTATISGTVQGQQATTTVSSIVPFEATAAAATTTASVQLTVTSATGQSASLTFSITLTISPLAITSTSPLTSATLGSTYSALVTAAGGLQPYTWGLATGSSLPAGLKLTDGSPSATISGTPTATGTFQFTLNVSDAETAPMSVSASFTLTVSTSSTLNCPNPVIKTLCGTYSIGLGGFNSSGGPTGFGATFVANSSGHVVSGGEEGNDSVSGHTSNAITGGSYVMDPSGDGRGVLTLINSNAASRTFRFVTESLLNFSGAVQIEEFDSSGTLGSGILVGPETPPIAQIPPNTILALALEGMNGSNQRAALLGDFQVGASGCNGASGSFNSLAGEHVVTNTAGTVNTTLTIAGTCTASDPNTGIGTAQITISGGTPFTNATLNFIYVDGAVGAPSALLGAVFVGTDPIAANQPILFGLATPVGPPPAGGYNAASIACRNVGLEPACLFVAGATTDGTITTGHGVRSIIRIITTPGTGASGTLTGVEDQNAGGTITTAANLGPFNYTVDSNGVGTISAASTIHFVVHGDTLDALDESKGVQTGSARQQNATTIEGLGQPYIVNLEKGSPKGAHVVGVITPTGATAGTFTFGTVDISSSAGRFAGVTASGTYGTGTSIPIDPATGRGTGTANLTGGASSVPIVIYARRHRQFVILDVQTSDPYVLGARLQ